MAKLKMSVPSAQTVQRGRCKEFFAYGDPERPTAMYFLCQVGEHERGREVGAYS